MNKNLIKINQLTVEYGEDLYILINESRENLKNLIWSKTATLETTLKFIEEKTKSEDKIFGIFLEDKIIGVLELRRKEENSELGYWLGKDFQGHGFMKIAVLKSVEENTHKSSIIAHIKKTNEASKHVLEFAGLQYDHTEIWMNEEWLYFKKEQIKLF